MPPLSERGDGFPVRNWRRISRLVAPSATCGYLSRGCGRGALASMLFIMPTPLTTRVTKATLEEST